LSSRACQGFFQDIERTGIMVPRKGAAGKRNLQKLKPPLEFSGEKIKRFEEDRKKRNGVGDISLPYNVKL